MKNYSKDSALVISVPMPGTPPATEILCPFRLGYGSEQIPYQVTADPGRSSRIAIHVDPDGSVSVSVPVGSTADEIRKAVQKKARWVSEHVADARVRYAHVRPREYVSGVQILYLGRRYVLKVLRTDDAPRPPRLRGNRLEVETRSGDPEDIKGRVRGWYKAKARDYFARRISEHVSRLPWLDRLPSFRLMEMSKQWGSCAPSGAIILNPHLIKAPRDCIDYVLIHELVHLKHHDHGPEFLAFLDKSLPVWRRSKHHLDSLVELLLRD